MTGRMHPPWRWARSTPNTGKTHTQCLSSSGRSSRAERQQRGLEPGSPGVTPLYQGHPIPFRLNLHAMRKPKLGKVPPEPCPAPRMIASHSFLAVELSQ